MIFNLSNTHYFQFKGEEKTFSMFKLNYVKL